MKEATTGRSNDGMATRIVFGLTACVDVRHIRRQTVIDEHTRLALESLYGKFTDAGNFDRDIQRQKDLLRELEAVAADLGVRRGQALGVTIVNVRIENNQDRARVGDGAVLVGTSACGEDEPAFDEMKGIEVAFRRAIEKLPRALRLEMAAPVYAAINRNVANEWNGALMESVNKKD